ncbi:hypothetical protein ES702_06349 [subsurface metagenome]
MTPLAVCESLYNQVRPVLKKESVDPDIKKMLACKYVSFMADIKSGKKGLRDLRERYREIIVLIEKG